MLKGRKKPVEIKKKTGLSEVPDILLLSELFLRHELPHQILHDAKVIVEEDGKRIEYPGDTFIILGKELGGVDNG